MLKNIFRNCSDIVFRSIRADEKMRWTVVFISTLVEDKLLEEHVLGPLLEDRPCSDMGLRPAMEVLKDRFISVGTVAITSDLSATVRFVLSGYAIILTTGDNRAMSVSVPGKAKRGLEEPSSEPVVRGPRDGFIENISTNVGLIRGRLKTSRLKLETLTIGELTQTEVMIAYIEGVADAAVVDEVRKRVGDIRIDGLLESNNIEEMIEDVTFTPFPQMQSTERPDVVAAGLLGGNIAILVDSTPFALLLPMTFWAGMQSIEDYYIRWPIATFVRWIRMIFLVIAIFAPALYVAITTFHQEMIPTSLLLSIAGSREPVPFPALIEALLMEIIFEALREAGIRLPKQIGQAISIVGALVIGQSAVEAGIISAPVVIIVSITGIAAFTIPRYSFANGVRLLRFPVLFLAGTLGLYGIALGFLGILLHLCTLRSFGVPYFAPVAPLSIRNLKDIALRVPVWSKTRQPPGPETGNR
ncbi:spore germination protein [Cohnella sp. CBP 2801]|uniref:Spore germination protein n=2 Tax=Cohnella zeiphila TaxID=2761120 RepID=A0A7X0SLB9_9BACL|nr:spore germination protein [Cohnella zeiphila]MBB6732117.1 spore germination protein [Cohnella zeiphila]